MPNWITITSDHLKAAGHGAIVDKAGSTATGSLDPVAEEIEGVVARVRRAIAQGGNALDADTAKVPNSLKALTIRMALYALMERIRVPLSQDQSKTRETDMADLKSISDPNKFTPIETPDTAAGQGEMQTPGGISTITSTPRDQYTREGMNGL